MKKITAGRDVLGEFAPKFAQLNDDVLFGEVWSRESELSARDRSLITVTALMAQELTDTSFTNIGKLLGKKDHTTIIHGVNKVSAEIQTNEELRNKIDIITKKINPS